MYANSIFLLTIVVSPQPTPSYPSPHPLLPPSSNSRYRSKARNGWKWGMVEGKGLFVRSVSRPEPGPSSFEGGAGLASYHIQPTFVVRPIDGWMGDGGSGEFGWSTDVAAEEGRALLRLSQQQQPAMKRGMVLDVGWEGSLEKGMKNYAPLSHQQPWHAAFLSPSYSTNTATVVRRFLEQDSPFPSKLQPLPQTHFPQSIHSQSHLLLHYSSPRNGNWDEMTDGGNAKGTISSPNLLPCTPSSSALAKKINFGRRRRNENLCSNRARI
jgi:hypothetical protein